MGTFGNTFGNAFGGQLTEEREVIVYVHTIDGNNTNDGSYDHPFATIAYALTKTNGSGKIIIKAGDHIDPTINYNLTGNTVIAGENRETTRLICGTKITSAVPVDGYTKVFKAATVTMQSYDYELWQHDIIDTDSEILTDEIETIQRGLTYRLTSTRLYKVASIAAIETATTLAYYHDGTDLYFSKATGSDLMVNPIVIPLWGYSVTNHYIAIENISILYKPMIFTGCTGYMKDVTVKFNNYTSILATTGTVMTFDNCEAAGSHEDGFGYNQTANCIENNCWAHNNLDEGSSAHEVTVITRYDGLYEKNVGGGITDVGSSTTHCLRTKCVYQDNSAGYIFTYYDVSGSNNGTALLEHCIGGSFSGQATGGATARVTCYQCEGTIVTSAALVVLPVAGNITTSNVTSNSFDITANIETMNYSTEVEIEYGLTTSYGSVKSVTGSPFTADGSLNETITGLTQFEEYHYRTKSINGGVTEYSPDAVIYITDDYTLNATLTSTGTGVGISTLRFKTTSDITVTLDGTAKFYSDAAGTLNESNTWTIVSGALRTIYLKVSSGSANMVIDDVSKIVQFGTWASDGWVSSTNAASLSIAVDKLFALTDLRIGGVSTLTGRMPTNLITLWLGDGTVGWVYNGALPVGITSLHIQSTAVYWTYSGQLPANITTLWLLGGNIDWTHTGPFLTKVSYLYLIGAKLNWTGLDFSGTGNITTVLNLGNYRVNKMSSADMVTLLTSMTNRVGSLPATITINDYADYASPPTAVTNAVATLKTTKSITTVNLGA